MSEESSLRNSPPGEKEFELLFVTVHRRMRLRFQAWSWSKAISATFRHSCQRWLE